MKSRGKYLASELPPNVIVVKGLTHRTKSRSQAHKGKKATPKANSVLLQNKTEITNCQKAVA